ncbi:aminotransferase class V-fold PLP-dependent enzyme [Pendulispora brunnea]|uniref:Aminotransferase class V-fold PLP-dependent enzyme n=1 Tax=Pendulispora brunnea TaxID=2905690 RepID=A0ABZ2KIQ4_9BACT
MHKAPLQAAFDAATQYLEHVADRPVARPVAASTLRERLGGPLADAGEDPSEVIRALASHVDAGLVASAGPRYFGFVIGGSLPAALAADWLTAVWDQNAALYLTSPAASVVETVVAEWLLDLLGLPASASVGLVTGGQMANFSGLAAARDEVLRRLDWDVEERGLAAAPRITVVVGAEAHATIYTALRFLGIGREQVRVVEADEQGRMRSAALQSTLAACTGPVIVCAQAGCVNTGAFDPLGEIAQLAHARGAWLHVDGAFGLWAAASTSKRALVAGAAEADSWAIDGHKWLNVPYDCGISIVRDSAAHARALRNARAAYLVGAAGGERDGQDWGPESSRRARAFPIYAALRSLGRRGVSDLVDRCCAHAADLAGRLRTLEGATVLNEVVLNQVLVRFHAPDIDAGEFTRMVIRHVQEEGTCWLGPTSWHGTTAMRISVSNWQTTAHDMGLTFASIARAVERAATSARPARLPPSPGVR